MTGHIPESFIDELLVRTDIVQLVSERLPLRRMGSNYVTRCPFHTEKTASFTVSQSKQFYHCFGCGAHGDAIRFVMQYEGLHFLEAVESLANTLGLTIPKEKAQLEQEARHSFLYSMLLAASQVFKKNLEDHPLKQQAIHYLKSRNITGKTAVEFGLGYAPPGWDELIKKLGKDKESLDSLLKTGLIIAKETQEIQDKTTKPKQRYYDRFRDRIVFPIRDKAGRVIGFGGRVINGGEPKYLNSPETSLFHKGQQLYGLYEARLKNRQLKNLIVVEGYLDVITLSQNDITSVVATLGTALTEKHLELLFRQVTELFFCFDGDRAGLEAAGKALKLCLPEMRDDRRIKFIILPKGEDPDSFVRKNGRVAFLNQLQTAKSLSDFLFDSASQGLDLTAIEGRAELVRVAKPLIMKLPRGVFQQMMLERLEEFAELAPGTLVKSRHAKKVSRDGWDMVRNAKRKLPATPALLATGLLLSHRNLLNEITDISDINLVDTPGTALLCAMIEILRKERTLPLDAIEKQLPSGYTNNFSLADLISIAQSVPTAGVEVEFRGAILRLKERSQEQAMELLLQKAKGSSLTAQEKIELKNMLDTRERNRVDDK